MAAVSADGVVDVGAEVVDRTAEVVALAGDGDVAVLTASTPPRGSTTFGAYGRAALQPTTTANPSARTPTPTFRELISAQPGRPTMTAPIPMTRSVSPNMRNKPGIPAVSPPTMTKSRPRKPITAMTITPIRRSVAPHEQC